MYSIEIEISTRGTDANRTKGHNRFKVHGIFKSVKQEIEAITRSKRPEKPLESFKISITRYGARCLDYDNLISSFKPYIDGLKLSGVIKDDGWKYIQHHNIFTDQKISTEKKLVIRVDEL
jgi:hypothetical protein